MIRLKYAGPCGRDCPRREPGCGATCEAWLAYEAERNAGYDKRARIVDICRILLTEMHFPGLSRNP